MASKQMCAIFAVIAFVLPATSLAKEFVVGDDSGWTIKFDYQAWAAGKEFRVGDTLVFKYPVGAHNVFKVNGTAFQGCTIPPLQEALTTGNDVIPLDTPGRKWYICGVGQHCAVGGQKLFINVLPAIPVAKEFVVGDGAGWTINFDYQAWAAGKDFRVGDKLVFKYPAGAHNVFKVNGTTFQACAIPPLQDALTTGNDVITLATPGRKWYICGVGQHCAVGGQKLFITVQSDTQAPSMAPAESENSSSSANGIIASGYQAIMVGAVAAAVTIMMMMVV